MKVDALADSFSQRYPQDMAAVTIQIPTKTLERVKALAESEGRSVDDVIGAIANEALAYELDGGDEEIDPAWRDELVRRIESVRNGTAQSMPAEEVFASIRARFSR